MKSLSPAIILAFICFCSFDCLEISLEDNSLNLDQQREYEESMMKFQNGDTRSVCPEASMIQPTCVCTINPMNAHVTLDCSQAQSEDELADVFNQTFTDYFFFELIVNQTGNESNINSLPSGIFGELIFQKITFYDIPSLEAIDGDVCDLMTEELVVFTVVYCGLTNFSMDFSTFHALNAIYLYNNKLAYFNIDSSTLTLLYLDDNKLTDENFEAKTKEIATLSMTINEFTHTPDFASHKYLHHVLLNNNSIAYLSESQFCHSSIIDMISVSANELTYIDENAICVVPGSRVHLHTNFLTTLNESVYRPIAENVITGGLHLFNNEWICDCQIDWIFKNDLLSKFDSETSCNDGQYFTSLDPNDFLSCPNSTSTL